MKIILMYFRGSRGYFVADPFAPARRPQADFGACAIPLSGGPPPQRPHLHPKSIPHGNSKKLYRYTFAVSKKGPAVVGCA